MKSLIVYDSIYGNTEKIAKAIGEGIPECKVLNCKVAADLSGFGLVVIGSPTHAGGPAPAMKEFLKKMPPNSLEGISCAAFDTRASIEDNGFFMKLIINFFGYAAPRIARELGNKKGSQIAVPEGFLVDGKEGPLKQGEIERAREWGKTLASGLQ